MPTTKPLNDDTVVNRDKKPKVARARFRCQQFNCRVCEQRIARSFHTSPRADDDADTDRRTTTTTTMTKTTTGAVHAFHANSRLHFIGSWRARYEAFLDEKFPQPSADAKHPAPPRPLAPGSVVMHVDMDCFFASVAVRDRPDLRDAPVAVSWGSAKSGRGEISSCNYVARSTGVRAGMWLDRALELCPNLVTLPYDFETYEALALRVYDVLFEASNRRCVGVSVDEAYVDVTETCRERNIGAVALAEEIREKVYAATKCTCSVGIGSNMLLARLATRRAKPNGVFYVDEASQQEFIAGTLVRDLPGIGSSVADKLKSFNALTCRKLLKVPVESIRRVIGQKMAQKLIDLARGIDNSLWIERPVRKSVGAQMSWGVRCSTQEIAIDFVTQLAGEVSSRMQRLNIRGSQMNLKLWRAIPNAHTMRDYQGHGACDVLSRSRPIRGMTNDTESIAREAIDLLRELNVDPMLIRGLGVSVTKLDNQPAVGTENAQQPTLSQMFAKHRPRPAEDPQKSGGATKVAQETRREGKQSSTYRLAESDEELAETESEAEDVHYTASLTQNDCDHALFHDSQAEIDSEAREAIQYAFSAAARCYAWQRHELDRLNISKRRRDTLSEDAHAKRAIARSTDVIAIQAKRRYQREGKEGLSQMLDEARALCRSQELLDERFSTQGAAFIAAWIERLEAVERFVLTAQ